MTVVSAVFSEQSVFFAMWSLYALFRLNTRAHFPQVYVGICLVVGSGSLVVVVVVVVVVVGLLLLDYCCWIVVVVGSGSLVVVVVYMIE